MNNTLLVPEKSLNLDGLFVFGGCIGYLHLVKKKVKISFVLGMSDEALRKKISSDW